MSIASDGPFTFMEVSGGGTRSSVIMLGILAGTILGSGAVLCIHGISDLVPSSVAREVASLSTAPQWSENYLASRVQETTPDERRALVKRFLVSHRHPTYRDQYLMKEVHYLAGVSGRAFDGWRRGEKKYSDNSKAGRQIRALLLYDIPTGDPRSLPPRRSDRWLM